jgi:hypothetical protein
MGADVFPPTLAVISAVPVDAFAVANPAASIARMLGSEEAQVTPSVTGALVLFS